MRNWTRPLCLLALAVIALNLMVTPAGAQTEGAELPFKTTTLTIELTDNDIELQGFVDGVEWESVGIFTPLKRRIFDLSTQRKLRMQGMSELLFASEPSHFPEEALAPSPEATEVVNAFLELFPAGEYTFEGVTINGEELQGVATLTHVLPALPEIVAPVSDTDDLPIVDPANAIIEWQPVTTQFIGPGPVDIVGYQVIVEQVEPFRMLTINLPASATKTSIQPEFLMPGQLYEFEILAIEASGNATISVGEFMTP